MRMSVRNLIQGYGDTVILDDISFEANSGELITILGPNGCGKSTLIKTLCGLKTPKGGGISLDDVPLSDIPHKELSKKIGYVPQNFAQGGYTTVYDAVLIGRRPHMEWMYSKEDIEICIDSILEMKLENYVDRFVSELSGGQMQRVSIARALTQNPSIYIFDEPTSSFDLKNQLNLMRIMKRIIKQKNACLVVALHDINLALRYSDRVIVLKDGKIYDQGSPESVITEKMIRDVYDVKAKIIDEDGHPYIHLYDEESDEISDAY